MALSSPDVVLYLDPLLFATETVARSSYVWKKKIYRAYCYATRSSVQKQAFFPSKRSNSRKIWPETSQTHEYPFLPKRIALKRPLITKYGCIKRLCQRNYIPERDSLPYLFKIPRSLYFPRLVYDSGMFRFTLLSTLLG